MTPPGSKHFIHAPMGCTKTDLNYTNPKYKAVSSDYQNQTEYKHHVTRHYFTIVEARHQTVHVHACTPKCNQDEQVWQRLVITEKRERLAKERASKTNHANLMVIYIVKTKKLQPTPRQLVSSIKIYLQDIYNKRERQLVQWPTLSTFKTGGQIELLH